MDVQNNIKIARRLIEEVFSNGNLNLMEDLLAKNIKFTDSSTQTLKEGLNEFKQREQMYRRAFPDKKTKIDDIFGIDDRVIVRFTVSATQSGELQGIAPTNKKVNFSGITIYRFDNSGRISEINQVWDRLALLEQLGEVQPLLALHR